LSIGNGRRGQALVEFALIVPVLLLMLVIAIDFGRLFFSYIETTNAAREGANYAAAHAGDSSYSTTYTSGVTAAALGETNAQGQRGAGSMTVSALVCFNPLAPVPTAACNTATNKPGIGYQVTVTVTQPFTFFTPLISGFFGGQLTLSSSATAPVLNPSLSNLSIPAAMCTVPDYYHKDWADPGSTNTWTTAGFTGILTNASGGHKIQSQTLTKGTSVDCASNMTVS
jgi:Flp pilus assembly protein TadG